MGWFKDRRLVIILLFLMWLGIMGLLYLKADEVTKDPCSICSKRMGKEVVCSVGKLYPISRTYYPNGTIYTKPNKIIMQNTTNTKPFDLIKWKEEGTEKIDKIINPN